MTNLNALIKCPGVTHEFSFSGDLLAFNQYVDCLVNNGVESQATKDFKARLEGDTPDKWIGDGI